MDIKGDNTMVAGGEEKLLYQEGETPKKCVVCGKETKRLVNTGEFEAEPEWTPLCDIECELKFEEKVSGAPYGYGDG